LSITIRAVGQAGRRGATRRTPNAAALLAAVDEWLPEAAAETLRGFVAGRRAPDGALEVSLHPAARPVRMSATDRGEIVVSALTVPVGPGYHTYVVNLLERMRDDLSIGWAPLATPATPSAGRVAAAAAGADPESSIDPTGAFGSGDRRDAERGHLGWLRSALTAVRDARRQRGAPLHLATPPGVRYTVDGAIATVLGPRDDAWLDRALGDPRIAADVWPWVADVMDARYLLNRALTLMWTQVRWRTPADAEETALVDDVLGLLRRAYPLEPGLPWPWPEWRELFELRGVPDAGTRQLLARGANGATVGGAPGCPAIGYRRHPVTITHEGWSVDVPGTFTESRNDEEWSGGESGRNVTLAGVETAEAGQPMAPDQFLRQVAGHLGRDSIEHDDGVVRGRARLFSDTTSGIEVATVEGFSAIRGRGAAIRIVIDDPQDWKWALDTWRGLRPA
jgi:hypothetical protein